MFSAIQKACSVCPRVCNINRISGKKGYCNTGTEYEIASVCIHKGEEPVLSGDKGLCNVFFYHCNLQCIFCQNVQISSNNIISHKLTLEEVCQKIIAVIETGINILGFVSPGHCVPQMIKIIKSLNGQGYHPRIIYNSNGYDNIATLKSLEGIVNIYLPDFKYADDLLAYEYSGVKNYTSIAMAAVKEMLRQKGNVLYTDENGLAESGLIIRHLVLPGHVENSLNVLRLLATELPLSTHISLMSQYFPNVNVQKHPVLGRVINNDEYKAVVREFSLQGFYKGWIQELQSSSNYCPDFHKSNPFE